MPADTPLKCPVAPHQADCIEDRCRWWMPRRNKCALECLTLDLRELLRQMREDGGE